MISIIFEILKEEKIKELNQELEFVKSKNVNSENQLKLLQEKEEELQQEISLIKTLNDELNLKLKQQKVLLLLILFYFLIFN